MANEVSIILSAEDLATGVIDGVGNALGGLGNIAGKVAGVALVGVTAAAGAMVAGLGFAVSEAADAERGMAQLDAVLRSTKGAAGMTKDAVLDLASSISKASTYEGDAILKGENLLLTFTNIGKDVFPDATQAMVDMAAAMGTDVSSGAIQLGKALNNPVQGISALTEVGVVFTEAQKAMVKQLVAAGDVAGAQKIILAELNTEFGGSAAAQLDTFSGRIQNITNQFKDMAEGVGAQLLPPLTMLIDSVITPAIPLIESFAQVIGDTASKYIGIFADAIDIAANNGGTFFENLTAGLAQLVLGLTGSADAFMLVRNQAPIFITAIQDAINQAVAFFSDGLSFLLAVVKDILGFILAEFAKLGPPLLANVQIILTELWAFWQAHGAQIAAVVVALFEVLTGLFLNGMQLLSGVVATVLLMINGNWEGAQTTMTASLETFLGGIVAMTGTDLETVRASWQWVFEAIGIIVSQGVADITAFFAQCAANIKLVFSLDWGALGSAIIDGIKQGVMDAAASLARAASDAAQGALNAAKNALGIHSPSQAFRSVGQQMAAGMALGMSDGTPGATRAAAQMAGNTVTNNYYLTGNYKYQSESSIMDDLRLMQMLGA